MDTKQAYNLWAPQYDAADNKTRDAEAQALRCTLEPFTFISCLEVGCGTGKNTPWLVQKAKQVTAVDFSEAMLAKAKEKMVNDRVLFIQADITQEWTFPPNEYDLITFSLVLEHINDLDFVFGRAADFLVAGGYVYVGELHPFKQYIGVQARFDREGQRVVVPCFKHHISDFVQAAIKYGLVLRNIQEHFDDADKSGIPRILTLLLQKP